MYDSREYTIADIFDEIADTVDLPYRFIDIYNFAKELNGRKRSRSINPALRKKIIEKYDSTCQMCGRKAPDVVVNVDHIIPRWRGGLTEEHNLWILCEECNQGKGMQILHTSYNRINNRKT